MKKQTKRFEAKDSQGNQTYVTAKSLTKATQRASKKGLTLIG